MLSKWVAVILMTLLMVGCGLQVGEKDRGNAPVKVEGQFSCLKNLGKTTRAYLNNHLSVSEINDFFSCGKRALNAFVENTEGEKAGYYGGEEVRQFLNKFFTSENPISQAHMSELMSLKRAMIGGSADGFTREEVDLWTESMNEFRLSLITLKPHLPYLNPKLLEKVDDPEESRLDEAQHALSKEARKLGLRMEEHGGDYNLQQLQDYFNEQLKFMSPEDRSDQRQRAERWGEGVRAFKAAAVGGPPKLIGSQEWVAFFESSAVWWTIHLRLRYFFDDEAVLRGGNRKAFENSVDQILDQLLIAVERQEGQVIDYGRLDDLINVADRLSLLPYELEAPVVRTVLRPTVDKIFGNRNLPASQRQAHGIDRDRVMVAREHFSSWQAIQEYLDLVFQSYLSENDWVPTSPARPFLPTIGLPDISGLGFEDPRVLRFFDIKRMPTLYKFGVPQPYLLVPSRRRAEVVENNYYDLAIKNALGILGQMLVAGYSEEAARARTGYGIARDEMGQLIRDFRPLLLNLKIMHPKAHDVGEKMFFEANQFTISGNGLKAPEVHSNALGWVEPTEGIELSSYMISNFHLSHNIYKGLLSRCPLGPWDVQGRRRFDRECFRVEYKKLLTDNWTRAAGMREFLGQLDEEGWNSYVDVLLSMVRHWDDSDLEGGWVNFTQIGTMTMILHYIEAMMIKFDKDEDGLIKTEEAVSAELRYRDLMRRSLASKCKDLSDESLKNVFLYVLANESLPHEYKGLEKPPELSMGSLMRPGILLWDVLSLTADYLDLPEYSKFYYEYAKGRAMGWDIQMDRLQVMKAFQLISLGSRSPSKANCMRRPKKVAENYDDLNISP